MSKYIKFRKTTIYGQPISLFLQSPNGVLNWYINHSQHGYIIADDNTLNGI